MGRTNSTLAFDNSTKLFTLTSTSQTIFVNGVPFVLPTPMTISLGSTPAIGLWYISIGITNNVPTLQIAQFSWSITNTSGIPCVTVYWNGTAGTLCDERHSYNRNLGLHEYLHKTVGARIPNDGSFAQLRPTTTNDGHIELTAGSLWDEDIENAITAAQGKLIRNWYETASGTWTFSDSTDNGGYDRPYLWNSGTSRLRFPDSDNAYTLTDCANNRYLPVWVYASNDIIRPIYVITPSIIDSYSTAANARNATAPLLPFSPELKLLYRWIYRGDGEYQEGADYRTSASLPSGGVTSPNASSVSFTPTDTIVSSNVQSAIEEVQLIKTAPIVSTNTSTHKVAISINGVTYYMLLSDN